MERQYRFQFQVSLGLELIDFILVFLIGNKWGFGVDVRQVLGFYQLRSFCRFFYGYFGFVVVEFIRWEFRQGIYRQIFGVFQSVLYRRLGQKKIRKIIKFGFLDDRLLQFYEGMFQLLLGIRVFIELFLSIGMFVFIGFLGGRLLLDFLFIIVEC